MFSWRVWGIVELYGPDAIAFKWKKADDGLGRMSKEGVDGGGARMGGTGDGMG